MTNITRRTVLTGALATGALAVQHTGSSARAAKAASLVIHDDDPAHKISPYIFGSNEIGAMDGGPLSALLDRDAGITARRLGGNLMTGYNWVTNAAHAGKDYRQSNGAFLLDALKIPKAGWSQPAIIIETMHQASLAMGARSFVTVPLGKAVAGDMAGPVLSKDAAPSSRFVPVQWQSNAKASDPVNRKVADIPHLLRRLIARYGDAGSARGIRGYLLDNEPGLWTQNHPRLFPVKTSIKDFIERSISVARIIKSIDPKALVCGPGSWGATGMVNLQSAPDWNRYKRYGSFLAAYLDAFARASRHDGKRLLDVLDVHWYPFSAMGDLFRTIAPALDQARLDAPRSLVEADFRENSWVPRALSSRSPGSVTLPVLPSLQGLIARHFPGTKLAITEFNYGGSKSLVSALALADALGSYCSGNVYLATHWGSLPDWLGQVYRVYRAKDPGGDAFGGRHLPLDNTARPHVSAYAAMNKGTHQVIAINKSTRAIALNVMFASGKQRQVSSIIGLDKSSPQARIISANTPGEIASGPDTGMKLVLQPRSIRRYALT